MKVIDGPVCDQGRCARVLAAIAERDQRLADRLGEQLAHVLRETLAELGHPVDDERVNAALQGAVRRMTGEEPEYNL